MTQCRNQLAFVLGGGTGELNKHWCTQMGFDVASMGNWYYLCDYGKGFD